MGVHDLRWARGHGKSRRLLFFLGKRKQKSSIGNRFCFVHHRIVPGVKREDFVSDRMSYV
jgi:cellulose synthase/poly-beta-1,6-N-acetylglucosamine synthase-like glycosyltransferase